MRSISLSLLFFGLVVAGGTMASTACDNPLDVPAATDTNTVDTVTLYALRGTDLLLPSAYDVVGRVVAHTDRLEAFDFAVDITDDGKPLLYPAGALGLAKDPGVLVTTSPFDSVLSAPLTGFVTDSVIPLAVQTVFVVRSRPNGLNCALAGTLPRYGKFRVITVDTTKRSITFEALIDANCGYRGLEPGLPTS
jgi:hypothetical protein